MFSFAILLFMLWGSALADSNPDEIVDLPGLNYTINFRQYSGYLNATEEKFLHYWFVESEKNPLEDPLILWLNGGPGCSSLLGLLLELGPFRVKTDGITLVANEYSWNKVANVLFLETPTKVGFSYSTNKDYTADDDQTAYDNYRALLQFFRKFPKLQLNELYVAGEGYAGIYVPVLFSRILRDSPNINLKGFAIGNGNLDIEKTGNSLLYFSYFHGFIDSVSWKAALANCCRGSVDPVSCDFISSRATTSCVKAVAHASKFLSGKEWNLFNIYQNCSSSKLKQFQTQFHHLLYQHRLHLLHDITVSDIPVCVNMSHITFWLNQNSVREALHIPSYVPKWEGCSLFVHVAYKKLYNSMRPQIMQALELGYIRGLIYNGDISMIYNFLGNEWFVETLGLKDFSDYQMWFYNGQPAGFYKSSKHLTFLTVKGAGHMVPTDQPGQALQMISSFLFNRNY